MKKRKGISIIIILAIIAFVVGLVLVFSMLNQNNPTPSTGGKTEADASPTPGKKFFLIPNDTGTKYIDDTDHVSARAKVVAIEEKYITVEEIKRPGYQWIFTLMDISYDLISNVYDANGNNQDISDFYIGQEFSIWILGGTAPSFPTTLEGYVDIFLDSAEQSGTDNPINFTEDENIKKPIMVCNDTELETYGGLTRTWYDNSEVKIHCDSPFVVIEQFIHKIPMTEISGDKIDNIALYDTDDTSDKVIERLSIYNIDDELTYCEHEPDTLPSMPDGKYLICFEYAQKIDGGIESRYLLARIDKRSQDSE